MHFCVRVYIDKKTMKTKNYLKSQSRFKDFHRKSQVFSSRTTSSGKTCFLCHSYSIYNKSVGFYPLSPKRCTPNEYRTHYFLNFFLTFSCESVSLFHKRSLLDETKKIGLINYCLVLFKAVFIKSCWI